VVYVAAVRTYKNAKGEGRVGSIEIMDSSGDVKGTFFNDDCDKWMETLKVNQVYRIRIHGQAGQSPILQHQLQRRDHLPARLNV